MHCHFFFVFIFITTFILGTTVVVVSAATPLLTLPHSLMLQLTLLPQIHLHLFLIFFNQLLTFLIVILINELLKIVLHKFTEPKHTFIALPHIGQLSTFLQMFNQVLEFDIVWVFFEGSDRDAIVKLRAERVNCVVHDQDLRQRHVSENTKVFNIDIIWSLDTLLSIKSMLDKNAFRI